MPNPNSFQPTGQLPRREGKRVLAVGRFSDSLKRLDRILEVFWRVHSLDSEARLVLVGDYVMDLRLPPSNRSLRQMINEMGFPVEAVDILGERADVRPYYEDAAVLLLASDCEGFGVVLTEAAIYGVPAVVYGTPGLEDIITQGENGYIVRKNAPEEAAACIIRLLQNERLWDEMSVTAQKMAQRFSLENVVKRWNALFDILQSDHEEKAMSVLLREAELAPSPEMALKSLGYAVGEYEAILAAVPDAASVVVGSSEPEESLSTTQKNDSPVSEQVEKSALQQSLSWRITRPLRAFLQMFLRFSKVSNGAGEGHLSDSQVQNSISWKITAPLRAVHRLFSRHRD